MPFSKQKQFCSECGKKTWFYHQGTQEPHCTERHPGWAPRTDGFAIPEDPSKKPPTEVELRAMNRIDRSLWQRSVTERNTRVSAPDMIDLFDADPEPLPVDKRRCSFCGVVTDLGMVQSEKQVQIKKFEEPYLDSDGQIAIKETIRRQVEEMHACPNCISSISKPVVARIV